jgi:hypothetical protein
MVKHDKGPNPDKPKITNSKQQIPNKFQYPNLKSDQNPIVLNFEFWPL